MAYRLGKSLLHLISFVVLIIILFPLGDVFSRALHAGDVNIPWHVIIRSLLQAGASACCAIIGGLPLAYVLLGKGTLVRILRILSLLPAVLPPLVVIPIVISLFGSRGLLPIPQLLYSIEGVVLVHALYNAPLAGRLIGDALRRYRGYSVVASTMGASVFHRIRALWIPAMLPTIGGVFIVVFFYSFTSFSIPLIFGGTTAATLEVEIYRTFLASLDVSKASYLALVQIMLLVPFLVFFFREPPRVSEPPIEEKTTLPQQVVGILYLGWLVLFLGSPLLRFTPTPLRFEPIINSITLATISATGAGMLFFALPRKIYRFLYLTIGISATTLALAYAPYAGNWLVLVGGHVFLCLHVYSLIFSKYIEELSWYATVAATYGARIQDQIVKVVFPLFSSSFLLAWLLSFSLSLSEVVIASVVSAGQFDTMTTTMLSRFSHYRFGEGVTYALILMIIALVVATVVDWCEQKMVKIWHSPLR